MPPVPHHHLLVPTNFRPAARWALQRALQLALREETRITLLHVSEVRAAWRETTGLDAFEMLHRALLLPEAKFPSIAAAASHQTLLRLRALERLSQELHPEWRESVDVQLAWRGGGVLQQILQFAREEQVDAIVLGKRRTRWPKLWPSLTDRIRNGAPCEVIIVDSVPPRRTAPQDDLSPQSACQP